MCNLRGKGHFPAYPPTCLQTLMSVKSTMEGALISALKLLVLSCAPVMRVTFWPLIHLTVKVMGNIAYNNNIRGNLLVNVM